MTPFAPSFVGRTVRTILVCGLSLFPLLPAYGLGSAYLSAQGQKGGGVVASVQTSQPVGGYAVSPSFNASPVVRGNLHFGAGTYSGAQSYSVGRVAGKQGQTVPLYGSPSSYKGQKKATFYRSKRRSYFPAAFVGGQKARPVSPIRTPQSNDLPIPMVKVHSVAQTILASYQATSSEPSTSPSTPTTFGKNTFVATTRVITTSLSSATDWPALPTEPNPDNPNSGGSYDWPNLPGEPNPDDPNSGSYDWPNLPGEPYPDQPNGGYDWPNLPGEPFPDGPNNGSDWPDLPDEPFPDAPLGEVPLLFLLVLAGGYFCRFRRCVQSR